MKMNENDKVNLELLNLIKEVVEYLKKERENSELIIDKIKEKLL